MVTSSGCCGTPARVWRSVTVRCDGIGWVSTVSPASSVLLASRAEIRQVERAVLDPWFSTVATTVSPPPCAVANVRTFPWNGPTPWCDKNANTAIPSRTRKIATITVAWYWTGLGRGISGGHRLARSWSSGGWRRSRVAVAAAGAWLPALLPPARIEVPLTVTREQVTYFDQDQPSTLPTVIDWAGPDNPGPARYAVPDPTRPGTAKLGEHMAGPVVDPDTRSFEPDPEAEARVGAWAGRRFTGLRPAGSETCLYTTTPDEDFVLDRMGPVVVGSACSGHGFKFAPLIGECLAALAMGEPPPVPLDRFRAARPSLARTK